MQSLSSRTSSALSRTKVTFEDCCLLQLRSQYCGFSGGCVWVLLLASAINIAASLRRFVDLKEQNNTARSQSKLDNSWAAFLAAVVFPKPGPPVIQTTETDSFWMASVTCFISCKRPNISSSESSSGRQLGTLMDSRSVSSRISLLSSCSQWLTCSSTRRSMSWSIGSLFRRSIFCR